MYSIQIMIKSELKNSIFLEVVM